MTDEQYGDEELAQVEKLLAASNPKAKNFAGELRRARQVIDCTCLQLKSGDAEGPLREALRVYDEYIARPRDSDPPS